MTWRVSSVSWPQILLGTGTKLLAAALDVEARGAEWIGGDTLARGPRQKVLNGARRMPTNEEARILRRAIVPHLKWRVALVERAASPP
jgi:hypothetical protein